MSSKESPSADPTVQLLSPFLEGEILTARPEAEWEPRAAALAAESAFAGRLTGGGASFEEEGDAGLAERHEAGPQWSAEFEEPKTAVISLSRLKIGGLPEIALTLGDGGVFEGFFREPPTSYNGWVTLTGKVEIDEAGSRRAYDSAKDRGAWPLKEAYAHVAVGGAVSSSTPSSSTVKKDGTFTTSTWIGYQPYLVRRIQMQAVVSLENGKKLGVKVVAELVDLAGFLALVDPKEKSRPSGQSHLEFVASVRKIYHGGPKDTPALQQLFDWLLYRNRAVKVLFNLNTPQEQRLRQYKILYFGGEFIEIGHVLCGIEAMPKQHPSEKQNLPKPVRPELLVTWGGDLGSVIQEVYVKDFWNALDTGASLDINDYLVREASRSDLIGDIDGINIGSSYDPTRSLADNLNAYYGKKSGRRFHDFIANSKDDKGVAELPLVGGQKPPKLSKQARRNIAAHVHTYLVYFWTTGLLYSGTDPNKRKLVDDMVQIDSPEMNVIVDYFVRFLEGGLAVEQRQGVTLQPEVYESGEGYLAGASPEWEVFEGDEEGAYRLESDYPIQPEFLDEEDTETPLVKKGRGPEWDVPEQGERWGAESKTQVDGDGDERWYEEPEPADFAEAGEVGLGESGIYPEFESPAPPKGLILAEHYHIPKTLPDGHAGTMKRLDAQDMNPGFISLISEDILVDRRAGGLQTVLDDLIRTKYKRFLATRSSAQESARASDRIRVALVDLTGGKLFKPDIAGWGSTLPTDGASVPKICPLYGVHQLQSDLNRMATKNFLTRKDDLINAAKGYWKKIGFSSIPRVGELFLFDEAADRSRPVSVRFGAELVQTIVGIYKNNDKCAANKLISQLGFPYLASVLWQSGLRHPIKGGLWLWGGYCCTDKEGMKPLINADSTPLDCKSSGRDGLSFRWKGNPLARPAPVFPHNVTALSVASYYTLLAQGRLVSDTASSKIATTLQDACSFFWDRQLGGLTLDPPPTKCGVVGNVKHDSILIKRTVAGKAIAYAAVALTIDAADFPFADFLKDLDTVIRDKN